MNTDLNGLSQRVIGCAYTVSNSLGAGFLESVYQSALAVEFERHSIRCVQQAPMIVRYRGREVGKYVADFIVEETLILEIKALSRLLPEHQAQLLNYLKASGLRFGLLLNFGRPKIEIKRLVLG